MGEFQPDFKDPFDGSNLSENKCFLCGIDLDKSNRTEEHIYPKWLQRKYSLYNKSLILANGTEIRYKDLKIPCCKSCNKTMGEKIEKPMERAVDSGYNGLVDVDRTIVFQWLIKLSYGTLYKEVYLKADRSNPNSESIISGEIFKELRTVYLFLKGIVSGLSYLSEPYSLLMFEIDHDGIPYWAHDGFVMSMFFIRMGDVGIIAHLQDKGCNERIFREDKLLSGFLSRKIHPIQYMELCAIFTYKSSLLNRKPFYLFHLSEDGMPIQVFSSEVSGEVYRDWNQVDFNEVLVLLFKKWGVPIEYDNNYKDALYTTLINEDGSYREIGEIEQIK